MRSRNENEPPPFSQEHVQTNMLCCLASNARSKCTMTMRAFRDFASFWVILLTSLTVLYALLRLLGHPLRRVFDKAAPPESSCDIGTPRLRKRVAGALCVISICCTGNGFAQGVKLPDFGDASESSLSAAEEKELGQAFLREIRAQLSVIDDAEVESYLDALGFQLGGRAAAEGQSFNFFMVESPAINAFAGPGGNIGINTGLLLNTRNESELAAVLAHEIAHVTQKHISRGYELQSRGNITALAGIIAAIVIGTQNSEAGRATAAAVSGAHIQAQLDFTRANEQEADRVGMQLLHEAGFDPDAMAGFFEQLQTASQYDRRPPEYLSTHPVTTSRIADARARVAQLGYQQHADSDAYHLLKARLRIITSRDLKKTLAAVEAELSERRAKNVAATAYSWALGLARTRRHREAREVLEGLIKEDTDRLSYRLALAEVKRDSGDLRGALSDYDEVSLVYPDNRAVIEGYSRTLLQARQPKKTLTLIDQFRRSRPASAVIYKLEAEAHNALGNTAASRLALAQHHYATGRLDAAILQLQRAADDKNADYYLRSRATARLRELEAEHAARKK